MIAVFRYKSSFTSVTKALNFILFSPLPDFADESGLIDNDEIRIPVQLMAQANIPADADLQITCLNGGVLIPRF